jgi:hypothetical protein
MNEELKALAATDGVRALCFHRGAKPVFHSFKPAYGPATAADLSRAVTELFAVYAQGNRPLQETWFQFPECGVLVLAAPGGQQSFLSFMLSDTAAIAAVSGPAKAFLARNSAA